MKTWICQKFTDTHSVATLQNFRSSQTKCFQPMDALPIFLIFESSDNIPKRFSDYTPASSASRFVRTARSAWFSLLPPKLSLTALPLSSRPFSWLNCLIPEIRSSVMYQVVWIESHLGGQGQKKAPPMRRANDCEQGSDQRMDGDPEHGVVEARWLSGAQGLIHSF